MTSLAIAPASLATTAGATSKASRRALKAAAERAEDRAFSRWYFDCGMTRALAAFWSLPDAAALSDEARGRFMRSWLAEAWSNHRGTAGATAGTSSRLTHGALVLHLGTRTASLRGDPLALLPREWALLEALMVAPARVQSRAALVAHLKTRGHTLEGHVLNALVCDVRRKLGAGCITTVRRGGYAMGAVMA